MTAKAKKEKGVKGKLGVDMIWCPMCEYVLNVDKGVKVRWWLEKTVVNRLGWTLDKKKRKKSK